MTVYYDIVCETKGFKSVMARHQGVIGAVRKPRGGGLARLATTVPARKIDIGAGTRTYHGDILNGV